MQKIIGIVCCLLMAVSCGSGNDEPIVTNDIVGTWGYSFDDEDSEGRMVVAFKADGTFVLQTQTTWKDPDEIAFSGYTKEEMIASGTYRVAENLLVMHTLQQKERYDDDDWSVEEIDDDDVVYTYSVHGNRLTITESDGESVVLDKMVRE